MQSSSRPPPLDDSGLEVTTAGEGTARLTLKGDWVMRDGLRSVDRLADALAGKAVSRLELDSKQLGAWDDALVTFLMQLQLRCDDRKVVLDLSDVPEGARRLVGLALAVPERSGARRSDARPGFFEAVGRNVLRGWAETREAIDFLGEVTLMFGRFFSGRAVYLRRDLWLIVQQCGADALPIVTVISLLIGMILGFVGSVQLQRFGAGIFVADLVAITMMREMGAVMTGIVLAGRTGAAFAAQIGTMQGNEEVDSLVTLGIPPMDFLVLPRMLALIMMMPLLTIYADIIGILGGWVVGASILGISVPAYYEETRQAADLVDFAFGIFKGMVFGAVVAFAGCLQGLKCGRSAASVGLATTSAVVTGIVYIIALDGLFAVITTILGI